MDELLEQEEKKALQKQAAKRRSSSDNDHDQNGGRDARRPGRDPYSAEREENNARRSRKSRDIKVEDEEMKDVGSGSDHRSANGSVRSRHRSRSPDPERGDRRDRRDGYRRRDYDSHRHAEEDDDDRYYRPGGSRGGRREYDNDRRNPDRRSDRRDTRDIDRYSSGGRDRRDERPRARSPPRARKARTPEPTDDERDRRTVFVQQLAARLRTKELQSFFEQVGPVVEAQIVKDRVSGRSKGVGYVEFKEEDSVQKAIQLTGQKLLGIPIIAQLTEAEKNRQARNTEGTATQSNGIPFHRLYVGNIHFSITEEDLRNVFEPFGELEFVQLQKEEQGRSKGYGFVQ